MTLISPCFPLLSSLTIFFILSVILPIMINFFKRNIHIHSFLGFNSHTNTTTTNNEYKVQLIKSEDLDIITPTKGEDKPQGKFEGKGIGFIDEMGGGVDGLMCCTESLGFESGDERSVDDHQMHEICDENDVLRKKRGSWKIDRSFPPPLKSLNRNGEPSFFLRPVRENGRLELTQVRVHRPEILHASRHDGRLTLHLIPDQSILEEEENEEEEIIEDVRHGKQEERVGEWRFPNEGLIRRCHQMVNQHHGHGTHHLGMYGIIIG